MAQPTPIPTPVPTPAPIPSDEDYEINQEKVLELNILCNTPILAVQKSAECNANVEQANSPIPTPVPTPAPIPSDEDLEIEQEKVLELNILCNTPILAVQKSAECNANVEQTNCEAMGMRTNEFGDCVDYDLFGPMSTGPKLTEDRSTSSEQGHDNDNDNENENENDKIIIDEPTEPKENEEEHEETREHEPQSEHEVEQED
jgi:hypothetical protein